jgi:hypothetical protein
MYDWETSAWYEYLDHGMQDLVRVAEALLRREVEEKNHTFHDYSFIVFPMAKAYEGFVKKFVFDLGIITDKQYRGEHFRIGKSLNPDLPVKYRKQDWVVEKLDANCEKIDGGYYHGKLLSRVMWGEWKNSRNMLFHYFPEHVHFVTLEEAEKRLDRLAQVMETAMSCISGK